MRHPETFGGVVDIKNSICVIQFFPNSVLRMREYDSFLFIGWREAARSRPDAWYYVG